MYIVTEKTCESKIEIIYLNRPSLGLSDCQKEVNATEN